MRFGTGRFSVSLLLLWSILIVGCASAPDYPHKAEQRFLTADSQAPLSQYASKLQHLHQGKSGVQLLGDPLDAMVARLLLISQAESSIDLQYYIYRGDDAGALIALALMDAADRGVRVRILLDDLATTSKDEGLVALARHPNIQVRSFNPNPSRHFSNLGMLFNFPRLNYRMHNKSLTADNQFSIVGGRNIGNEYFAADEALEFGDLDLWLTGPVVTQASASFDDYWNAPHVQPISALSDFHVSEEQLAAFTRDIEKARSDMASHPYLSRLINSRMLATLTDSHLENDAPGEFYQWYWGMAELWSDPPLKQARSVESHWVVAELWQAMQAVESELLIISPYFVPTVSGADLLAELSKRGVKVIVVTNSLAATDVLAVHAGYQNYRQQLLEAGVTLYEIKPDLLESDKSLTGSSKSSLHAKTVVFDRQELFVGSFNFDPRSALLNTEMGVMVEQPLLAGRLSKEIEQRLPSQAYELNLEQGTLIWLDRGSGRTLHSEPGAGWWQRLLVELLSWLPIESQL